MELRVTQESILLGDGTIDILRIHTICSVGSFFLLI